MRVKRGRKKRLKKRAKWKYRLMLCESRKKKAKSSQMKGDKLQTKKIYMHVCRMFVSVKTKKNTHV